MTFGFLISIILLPLEARLVRYLKLGSGGKCYHLIPRHLPNTKCLIGSVI